jgi:hypothetical protein
MLLKYPASTTRVFKPEGCTPRESALAGGQ